MDETVSLRDIVKPILGRYPKTSLITRWEEATASDRDPKPLAFWIRESDDLVNIVWLNRSGVWDITWYPNKEMTTFNFAKVSAIVGFEVREAAGVAEELGLKVTGHYVVDVFAGSGRGGGFIWVAKDEKEAAELRVFVGQLSKLLLEV